MKKNKIVYIIYYFLIYSFLILIFTPLFLKSNSLIISYSFNEKSENNALDFFEISLNYENLSNTKLEIISNEKTYSFLNPQQTFKFFPKEYGKHEINLYKDNALIDSTYFIYANENSIYTDKSIYSIGEQVTISIISNEEPKNFILELTDSSQKKYNLFSPSSIINFIPNNQGNYKIKLLKENKIISETEFYVEKKEIETISNKTLDTSFDSEIVKTHLKIKTPYNLSNNLSNFNNSLIINHKRKNIEYEIEKVIDKLDVINNLESASFNENFNQNSKQKTKIKLKNSHLKEIEISDDFEGNLKLDEPEIKKIYLKYTEIPVLASYAIDPSNLLFNN
ncbi:MAG: hypothetical protein QXR96_03545, partial [Candidatus Woesearchaeota archaeon]